MSTGDAVPAPGQGVDAAIALPRGDVELTARGWQPRFVAAPPRLAEMMELYRELGYEVRAETLVDEDLDDHCAGCRLALAMFRVVYTRKPS
jgi:hypothetical protein